MQGVGYPNPNRSHDVSMAIWHTARLDREEHKTYGWIGRAMDQAASGGKGVPAGSSPSVLLAGDESPPVAVRGRRATSVALNGLEELRLEPGAAVGGASSRSPVEAGSLVNFVRRSALDSLTTAAQLETVARRAKEGARYPRTKLAGRLNLMAQLIKADFGARVYYAMQPGYDTHAVQLPAHAELLAELSAR